MPDRIHLTVATVIAQNGRFLMVRETEKTTGRRVINQPAGHVDPGESLAAAALRETLEETGWEVELKGIIGISIYTSPSNGITYYRISFAADPIRKTDQPLDSDIEEAVWLSLAELEHAKSQLRSPIVLQVIEDFLAGVHYPLDMIREHR